MITSLYVIILIIIKVIKIIVKNNIVLFYRMEMNYVAFIFVFTTILQSIEGQFNTGGYGAVRNIFSKKLFGHNQKTSCGSAPRVGMKNLGFRSQYYAAPKFRSFTQPSIAQPDLADFEVQSTSNIDENTGVITFDVKNIGTEDATGYDDVDWRRIIEVTTDINEATKLLSLPANAPFYVLKDGVTTTYYQKSEADYNLTIMPGTSANSIHGQNYYISTNAVYLINSPPLKADDSISFKFTGDFEIEKTYMVCADDPLYFNSWPTTADTEELIDDAANPSNNYFVFTYNKLSEPEP